MVCVMRYVAIDSETDLIQKGLRAPPWVCVSVAGPEGTKLHLDLHRVRELLLDRDAHLVFCNAPFDLAVFMAADPTLVDLIFDALDEDRIHDVAVREALHDIAIGKLFIDYETGEPFAKRDPETGEMSGRYSLKILARRHLGLDLSKAKVGGPRTSYARLRSIPLDQWSPAAKQYAIDDAVHTLAIFHKQEGHQNLHDESNQVRGALGLHLMHCWGLRTDEAYVTDLERKVDDEWNRAREKFTAAGIYRPNGTKDKKRLAKLVSQAFRGSSPTTPKGEISTDRDTLEESGDPLLMELAQSGKNDKRKTTYIPRLKEGFHRPLTPEFNAIVATGRVSSDFQQLPQKGGIREAIIARPGYVFVSCDYEGLELRTMSERAIQDPDVRYSKMADMLNEGMDVHTYVAAGFKGMTYEEALPLAKSSLKSFRDLAKIFNFGKGGGMGAATMAYQARAKDRVSFCTLSGRAAKCGENKQPVKVQGKIKSVCSLCVEVSKELGSKWLKVLPEQGALFAKAGRLTKNGHTSVVVFGSNRVRGDCGYTQWLNSPFQGAGGDGVKLAQWRVQREMYTRRDSPLWDSRLALNVHDELVGEIRETALHDGAFLMARIMVDAMNEVTPHVRNKVVPAACRRLFKSATDVYTKDKKLRPWWPKDWAWPADQDQKARDEAA